MVVFVELGEDDGLSSDGAGCVSHFVKSCSLIEGYDEVDRSVL